MTMPPEGPTMSKGARVMLFALIALAVPGQHAQSASLADAARVLKAESGADLRRYSTRDFGRERFTGARSVIVDEERARDLLKAVRARLPARAPPWG